MDINISTTNIDIETPCISQTTQIYHDNANNNISVNIINNAESLPKFHYSVDNVYSSPTRTQTVGKNNNMYTQKRSLLYVLAFASLLPIVFSSRSEKIAIIVCVLIGLSYSAMDTIHYFDAIHAIHTVLTVFILSLFSLNKGFKTTLLLIIALHFKTSLTLNITAGRGWHSCALSTGAALKCWGFNADGQLGHNHTNNIGDAANEMGDFLLDIDLGSGFITAQIVAGYYHTCALSTSAALKCWGRNDFGQLGYGDSHNRGDGADEMGENLLPIDLGSGFNTTQIAAGHSHTCAVSTMGTAKCWGFNDYGQLGYGDNHSRGNATDEMGDFLLEIALGSGFNATQIVAGWSHTCALSTNGAVKCWGIGNHGRLGYGDLEWRGDGADEMGDFLLEIELGTGFQATQIVAGCFHTCALSVDGVLKCWGRNNYGQLGYGDNNDRGDVVDEMGAYLSAVDLGSGFTASQIVAGCRHSCALSSGADLKCWGRNNAGQLGYGDEDNRGDGTREMGGYLAGIELGSGFIPRQIVAGAYHTCALSTIDALKCWGSNGYGELGYGDMNVRGDAVNEMGDYLSEVDLGSGFTPTVSPTVGPSISPTIATNPPSISPSDPPTQFPTNYPTQFPTNYPSSNPTFFPTNYPSSDPTFIPTWNPSSNATHYTHTVNITIIVTNITNNITKIEKYLKETIENMLTADEAVHHLDVDIIVKDIDDDSLVVIAIITLDADYINQREIEREIQDGFDNQDDVMKVSVITTNTSTTNKPDGTQTNIIYFVIAASTFAFCFICFLFAIILHLYLRKKVQTLNMQITAIHAAQIKDEIASNDDDLVSTTVDAEKPDAEDIDIEHMSTSGDVRYVFDGAEDDIVVDAEKPVVNTSVVNTSDGYATKTDKGKPVNVNELLSAVSIQSAQLMEIIANEEKEREERKEEEEQEEGVNFDGMFVEVDNEGAYEPDEFHIINRVKARTCTGGGSTTSGATVDNQNEK